MAFQLSEELVESGNYKQLKLNELEIGDSVVFFFADKEDRSSSEFGDFTLYTGLELNVEAAKNFEDVVETAEAASFIPNTMLSNTKLEPLNAYRIEKLWNRGDKTKKGQKAKGFGFKIFKLQLDKTQIKELQDKFLNNDNSNSDIKNEAAPWL